VVPLPPGLHPSDESLGQPARKGQDLCLWQPAGRGGPRGGPLAGQRHELLGSQHVRGDEGSVQRPRPLQLRGDGPGEKDIGARQQCRCRSACSAIFVRSGSTTTSLPPARFDFRMHRTR